MKTILAIAALMLASTAFASKDLDPVTYFPAPQVNAAFEKGSVLYKDGPNYMVHASRREGPGMVEVHTLDADIIYVLGGTSTIVTGGKMIGGKTIAPDEIRGTSIEGGETRYLATGDVMIIPHGTPHWFKEVDAPFTYYVVKVR